MVATASAAGAARVVALATAAFRHAGNGEALARRISEEAGVHVRVVEGAEEARLALRGQQASLGGLAPMVGLDLGGGSLEVAAADGGGGVWATSVDAGVARLAARLAPGCPPAGRDLRALRRWLEAELAPLAARVGPVGAPTTALSGGTAGAVARLAVARRAPGRPGRGR